MLKRVQGQEKAKKRRRVKGWCFNVKGIKEVVLKYERET